MASGHMTALKGRTHGRTDQCCRREKSLANSEPSTHGPFRPRLLLSNLELITLETLSARIRPEDLDPLKGRFSGHPQHTGQPETDFRILDDGKIRRTWSGTRATTGIAQKVTDSVMRF